MEGIRFTKEVVQKFLDANDGYLTTRPFGMGLSGWTEYRIEQGVLHIREYGKDKHGGEPFDNSRIGNSDEARRFIRSELEKFSCKLVIPEL